MNNIRLIQQAIACINYVIENKSDTTHLLEAKRLLEQALAQTTYNNDARATYKVEE